MHNKKKRNLYSLDISLLPIVLQIIVDADYSTAINRIIPGCGSWFNPEPISTEDVELTVG